MFVVPLVIVAASVLFAPNGFVAVGVSAFALLAAFPVFALSLVGSGRQSEGAWSRYGASPGQQLPESKEPPKRLQEPEVAKPTQEELELAACAYNQLLAAFEPDEN